MHIKEIYYIIKIIIDLIKDYINIVYLMFI